MKSLFPIFSKGILACLLIATCHFSIEACSMVQLPEPPRSMVNPGLYILVGEVIGYTEPVVDPENFRGEAVGIKLKVVESIQLPHHTRNGLELFRFSHDSDCVAVATSAKPPLGTRFRMAVAPVTLVASKSGNGGVRLQSNVFSVLDIDRELFGYSTKSDLEFDYKNDLPKLVEKVKQSPEMENRRWLYDFLYIETSKDLIRFAKAKTELERMKILERLLYCPNINFRRLVYSEFGRPFESEERIPRLKLLQPGRVKAPSGGKKLSKREKELMAERTRLESLGALKF